MNVFGSIAQERREMERAQNLYLEECRLVQMRKEEEKQKMELVKVLTTTEELAGP